MRTVEILVRALWHRFKSNRTAQAVAIVVAVVIVGVIAIGSALRLTRVMGGPPTSVFGLNFADSSSQAVSAVGESRIRYSGGVGKKLQMSLDGRSYVTLGSSIEDAYLIGTAAGGLPGGRINLTTAGGPFALLGGDDSMDCQTLQTNSNASTGPWLRLLNGDGVTVGTLEPADAGQSGRLHFTTLLNGFYTWLMIDTPVGPVSSIVNGQAWLWTGTAYQFTDPNGNPYMQVDGNGALTQRVSQLVDNVIAFTPDPPFDCTSGDFIHFETVSANITGPTMVDGLNGEHCTIVMLKNATASAFTVTGNWGPNVRANSATFSTAASSLLVYKFAWDNNLLTPAWVQESAAVTVP